MIVMADRVWEKWKEQYTLFVTEYYGDTLWNDWIMNGDELTSGLIEPFVFTRLVNTLFVTREHTTAFIPTSSFSQP